MKPPGALAAALTLAIAVAASFAAPRPVVNAQAPLPRLLVVIVADQLRADYIDAYRHRWRDGMRTLLEEGAWFTRAEYPYLNTATCVGHVTIATGALPRTHGIVLNRWWNRDEERAVNCTDDETSPELRYDGGPARFGTSARHVLVPTLADRLRAQRPDARVVSLALKARAAVGLAGRGGSAVTWFDDTNRTFATSQAFAASPVASVADFLRLNPPEGDHGRVWTLHDAEDSYRFPDLMPGERPKAGWTAVFPHAVVGASGPDAQYFDRWQKSPFSDAYLGRMAAALVDAFALGRRDTTDYLAVSFSALDLLGHDFGPDTREVEDLLIRLDITIGALLRHLDARVGRDNYVVALSADHGAAPTPEPAGGGRIATEDVQEVLEQALVARWGPAPRGRYVPWVGAGAVYFGTGVYDRLVDEPGAMQAVLRTLLAIPGMEHVVRRDALADAGDDLARAAAAGFFEGRSGDLWLVPKRHWIVELRAENEATTHGTFYDYDRRVPILLRGHRIRPGRYGTRVTPADIAPTLAYLAGVTLAQADGRLLSDALR
jgi:hypothetical protein